MYRHNCSVVKYIHIYSCLIVTYANRAQGIELKSENIALNYYKFWFLVEHFKRNILMKFEYDVSIYIIIIYLNQHLCVCVRIYVMEMFRLNEQEKGVLIAVMCFLIECIQR